jgi:hypothetical protein
VQNIQLDDDIVTALSARARAGESVNDVLRGLLAAVAPERLAPVVTLPAQRSRVAPLHRKDSEFRALISLGLLEPGDRLVHQRPRGELHLAVVREDGSVELGDGTVHDSPSTALSATVETSRNGWKDWRHERTQRTLAELHIVARGGEQV